MGVQEYGGWIETLELVSQPAAGGRHSTGIGQYEDRASTIISTYLTRPAPGDYLTHPTPELAKTSSLPWDAPLPVA